ncbi:MAG: CARDB domain-containing protein, partial [Promethearchaeota archaeon]
DEYFINRTSNDNLGSNTELYLVNYAQNETVLNPDEDVNFTISLENRHLTINYDVSITVELISLINPSNEWIITSGTSSTQNLAISGDPNGKDKKEFEISINIPTPAEGGINCPLRNGPMAIKLSVDVDGTPISEEILPEILYYSSMSESQFEGDVCQPIKIYEDRMGPSFIAAFDRSTMELPENITYFAQVINDYYMSTENEIFRPSEFFKVDGDIVDFKIEQDEINRISNLNLTGQAVDEYQNPLSSVILSFEYNNSGNWVNLIGASESNQITTDQNGFFNFEFSLLQTPLMPEIEIIATYSGNSSVMYFNKSLNVILTEYKNSIELTFENQTLINPNHNIISFKITNTGNSTLENVTLSIYNSTYSSTVYPVNRLKSAILHPGESLSVDVDFFDKKYSDDYANVSIKVEAYVSEIGEVQVIHEQQYTFKTYSINESRLSSATVVFFFFVGLGVLWVFGGLFIRKNIIEFNTLPESYVSEKKTAKKRRTGKYVNISDLSRKTEKKPEESEGSTTSLDDLLNEEDSK